MGKYDEVIEELVTNDLKSTNRICKELKEKTKKHLGWEYVYRILFQLSIDGKIKKIDTDNTIFWKKSNGKE